MQIDISPTPQDPNSRYLDWPNPHVEFVSTEGEPEKAIITPGRNGLHAEGDVKITVTKERVVYEKNPASR